MSAYGDGTHGVVPAAAAHARPRCGRCCRDGRVLGVIADRPLHRPQLAQIAHAARTIGAHLLRPDPGRPGRVRTGCRPRPWCEPCSPRADRMPPADSRRGAARGRRTATRSATRCCAPGSPQNYGATHLLSTSDMLISGGGLRVLVPRELAYDTRDGQWRASDDIPQRFRRLAMTPAEIDDLLDDGSQLPEWHTPPAVARELARARPPRRHRGFVVFFTGLSGSGKSTIARGVADALRETGERTVTFLDGDVVRRELSAGLTFSKADRDLNIRRIGWVAAEVARHGGLAICCPIAPYAAARATARAAGAGGRGGLRPGARRRPRSRSANSATARASTPRRAPA